MKFSASLAAAMLATALRLHGAGGLAFELRDTQGVLHTQAEFAAAKAVVVYFTTTDCPIANNYVPEMNRIHRAYAPRGVAFFAVQTDLTAAPAAVAAYARDFGYAYPLLLDPQQVLVRYTGATVTPQAAILSPRGALLYLGRVDNRVAAFGTERLKATVTDLRDALDAVLADKPVAHSRTKSVGCAIARASSGRSLP